MTTCEEERCGCLGALYTFRSSYGDMKNNTGHASKTD